MKIISGGQTGVDQAALRAAMHCGLEVGGWCPPGRTCESGRIPSHFPLHETPEDRTPGAEDIPRSQRTEWNVRDADATLILQPADFSSADAGTCWTHRCTLAYGRPVLTCDPADPNALAQIREWLRNTRVQILNIAGPSEGTAPGISDRVHTVLLKLFSESH